MNSDPIARLRFLEKKAGDQALSIASLIASVKGLKDQLQQTASGIPLAGGGGGGIQFGLCIATGAGGIGAATLTGTIPNQVLTFGTGTGTVIFGPFGGSPTIADFSLGTAGVGILNPYPNTFAFGVVHNHYGLIIQDTNGLVYIIGEQG